MERLQLKHLAPYLPYGFLYGIYDHQKVIIRGMNYNSDYLNIDFEINNHNKVSSTCFFNEIKPILRPLSDLTKEIEVNGEKFVPLDVLADLFGHGCLDFDLTDVLNQPYKQMQKILEWHFDVFNLHSKKLCIYFDELK
jgi:hypothetical protein